MRRGEIWIELNEVAGEFNLRYRDSGVGLPPGFDLATGWGTPNVANLVADLVAQ